MVCLDELENSAGGQQLGLRRLQAGDVFAGHGAICGRSLLDETLCLRDAEAPQRLDHPGAGRIADGHGESAGAKVAQRPVEQRGEFVVPGRPESPGVGEAVDLRWGDEPGSGEHEGLAGSRLHRRFFDRAQDDRVVEIGVDVGEEEDPRSGEITDELQRLIRTQRRILWLTALAAQPGSCRPQPERRPDIVRRPADEFHDARLVVGRDHEHRVVRGDQGAEVRRVVHMVLSTRSVARCSRPGVRLQTGG